MTPASIIPFIHDLTFDDLPASVIQQAQRCLIDLIGTAAGGSMTDTARIICNHARRQFAVGTGRGARMLFDGRRVSAPGAALAGGMMIDSLDCHDGHVLTKGHVGVAVLPALLALIDSGDDVPDGKGFLTDIVLGYEIATRAGIALHSTACDYHSSGAWNALACAALGARHLRLSPDQTRQALGIAEYHGPRSQIMRVVDYPTMVKDGSGWGAMAGLSAAWLADDGFTGAPALTVEHADAAAVWEDLGTRWRIREQYFKAYPVCRWAQPAIEAALSLQRQHQIQAADIAQVEVSTFHEGTRLATCRPKTTDEAQYSLPFPVAAALVRGQVSAAEVTGGSLNDADILRLADAVCLIEDSRYNARFPAERWAHVTFQLHNGRRYTSEPAIARGNPENPLSSAELLAKYRLLSEPVLGFERAQAIDKGLNNLTSGDFAAFLDLLLSPAATSEK
ncbi:MAG: MmgE/PrpD family protein [Anaerolineae bacterium]|nr:MmgE/PrpD family protein [Anaerolineae bacterium]NUQ04086.1 MmgE/PrpD family protein [Anaerolineae bacterium]